MLDLGECNVMEELNQELAGNIHLITGETFDSDEDGRDGNDKGIKGIHPGHREESDLDGLRVGQGCVGRFIRGRGQKVGHGVGEGVMK